MIKNILPPDITLEEGRAVCYICDKPIEGKIYKNDLDRRYYCSIQHAQKGREQFLIEKNDEETLERIDKEKHEKQFKLRISKALKKGIKPAKSITIFKATSESGDKNSNSEKVNEFIDSLHSKNSCQTISILNSILGRTLKIGKTEEIQCKYKFEGRDYLHSKIIQIEYPNEIDFYKFSDYMVDKGTLIPIIVFSTNPKSEVVITMETIVKIIHEHPEKSRLGYIKSYEVKIRPDISNLKEVRDYKTFKKIIKNLKMIHYYKQKDGLRLYFNDDFFYIWNFRQCFMEDLYSR